MIGRVCEVENMTLANVVEIAVLVVIVVVAIRFFVKRPDSSCVSGRSFPFFGSDGPFCFHTANLKSVTGASTARSRITPPLLFSKHTPPACMRSPAPDSPGVAVFRFHSYPDRLLTG